MTCLDHEICVTKGQVMSQTLDRQTSEETDIGLRCFVCST